MLTSNLRTTVLTLAATVALSGTAAPLASAQQYTGSNGTASAETCAEWFTWYKEALARANKAVGEGKSAEVTKSYNEALYELQKAKGAGCPWASVAMTPVKPKPKTAVSVMPSGAPRAH